MLSRQLEVSLRLAVSMARQKRHEFLTVEHLLLALLDNDSAVNTLKACGAEIVSLRKELEEYVEQHTPKLPENSEQAPHPTESFDRILQRAIFHVQSSGSDRTVEGADVLVAMYSERDSFAIYLLKRHQINRLTLTQYLSHGARKDEVHVEEEADEVDSDMSTSANAGPLELYTLNLNHEALKGKTDPLIGREKEIERAAQILCRRRKNNPLLVGDPGVGKTSIAEGLAWLIVNNKAPKPLANTEIYSLDIGALVAGTKYRGDFEKRLKQLLNTLKKKPDAVLFIDEIHMIIGAGSSMGSTMDASNLIKPALANGSLRCIGSTTFQEYRQVFEKDHALSRRFQKIDVNEPSISETIDILRGLKSKFEEFHHVEYDDQALVSAVELSAKFINDRFLPDKAIDVIDEAGAQRRLKTDTDNRLITVENIEDIVSKIARIPPKTVSKDDKTVLSNLERDLKRVVFGQDDAITALSSAIKLSRAGLKSPDKPVGSFVFAGPTGVGKTEVTKQLAKLLGVELVRFDMSEYMERHAVSRLIGAPPGYVGFDQGGLLTDMIHKNPHCVLLLDEIEKAHPDVFNLLLQIMDHGSLTDNNGRKSDFRNVIIVLTTNIGAESISRSSIGFTEQDNSKDNQEAMKRAFSPEFRNRLDAIIQFKALPMSVIESVVDKFLTELQAQLDDKKVVLDVDQEARDWLAENGYDRNMGARPMQRLIQEHLKKPLAEMILFGELADHGGNVAVTVKTENGQSVGLKLEVFEDQAAEPA
ncbi:ATP-dependent Clp protease ATP-binding subunit ClpA [Acinetobacter rudis]|uniref:ATP-dependent Clp protease ATP-binding subunit ClpA n=1 Tax=Acinetobacter rudis TaxID=632955 RepID=A0AAW8J9H9_9GAMM|nr:ATP-dependent Clp protease ATP-binding subunit ClpA [Acinetobacter rudis]MDQ8935819.1 ATP-dependent Clp protease ATP-binding subunit ClpA [Acinetobacter rudis]MDQ8954308.1 ATP-dependent Clp protease ATP-binding subunit ClpA [Acinetobacter rudis]MDQ9018143.1 ATP-dependent Clp protease ATP-binding subunit ClpA [Acinetobacter rudis]